MNGRPIARVYWSDGEKNHNKWIYKIGSLVEIIERLNREDRLYTVMYLSGDVPIIPHNMTLKQFYGLPERVLDSG